MRHSKLLWGLAFLNAVLVMVLMWKVGGENTAVAQVRGRSDIIIIPTDMPGATNGVMFMLDTQNGILGAVFYDQNQRALNVTQPIDVGRLFAGPGAVGR